MDKKNKMVDAFAQIKSKNSHTIDTSVPKKYSESDSHMSVFSGTAHKNGDYINGAIPVTETTGSYNTLQDDTNIYLPDRKPTGNVPDGTYASSAEMDVNTVHSRSKLLAIQKKTIIEPSGYIKTTYNPDKNDENTKKQFNHDYYRKFNTETGIGAKIDNITRAIYMAPFNAVQDDNEYDEINSMRKMKRGYDKFSANFTEHAEKSVYKIKKVIAANERIATELAVSKISDINCPLTLDALNGDKNDIYNRLISVGFNEKNARLISKNAASVKNNIESQQILLEFAAQTGKLKNIQVDFVKSDNFYDDVLFDKKSKELTKLYFRNSKNELLNKKNPANMSLKDLKKLEKRFNHAEKLSKKIESDRTLGNPISDKDVKFVNSYLITTDERAIFDKTYRDKKQSTAKNRVKRNRKLTRKTGKIAKKIENMDCNESRGLRNFHTVFDVSKKIVKVGTVAGRLGFRFTRFVYKKTGMQRLVRYTGKRIAQGVKIIKNTAAIKINKKMGINGLGINGLGTNGVGTVVAKPGTMQHKLETVKNGIRNTKNKINNVKRTASKSKNKIKTGVNKFTTVFDKILNPFTAPIRLLNTIKQFLMKHIAIPLLKIGFIFLIIYVLVIFISSFGSAGGTTGQQLFKNVITADENTVREWVAYLKAKEDEKYEEIIDEAKQDPITDTVLHDVDLYCYGSPKSYTDPTRYYYHNDVDMNTDLLNGYHIYFLDSAGNVVGNNTTNIKDLICIMTVLLGNDFSDEYDSDDPIECLDALWDGMQPIITTKEGPLYHTDYSADTYPFNGETYYCNDTEFYTGYNDAVSDGVYFIGTVAGQNTETPSCPGIDYVTGTGCCHNDWSKYICNCGITAHSHTPECYQKWVEGHYLNKKEKKNWVDGHYEKTHSPVCGIPYHSHTTPCYTKETYRDYYCPGHNAVQCSYGYRDLNVYVTLLYRTDMYRSKIDSDNAIISYNIPYDYDARMFNQCESVVDFDDFGPHMKLFIGYNNWDYMKHKTFSHYNANAGYCECECDNENKNDATCSGNIEWCDALYAKDWFELYHVDAFGTTLQATKISGTDIEKIMTKIDSMYIMGTVSDERKNLVRKSLEYVGKIPYWKGGRAKSNEFDSRWGTAANVNDVDYETNTTAGRTLFGLDEIGFVKWLCEYGSQIQYTDLKPGDVGMLKPDGTEHNLMGIFAGFDENNQALWIHSSNVAGNVVLDNANCFSVYYEMK